MHILPVGNRGGIFAPKVSILDFDGQIDTPERGEMVRQAIGARSSSRTTASSRWGQAWRRPAS